jgi:hypothetical protein
LYTHDVRIEHLDKVREGTYGSKRVEECLENARLTQAAETLKRFQTLLERPSFTGSSHHYTFATVKK